MRMLKFVGIDPASSRNIGWSSIEISLSDGKLNDISCSAGTFVIPPMEERSKCLWQMFTAVESLLVNEQPIAVVIEKTSSFAGGFITGQVSNCIGAILACCGKHGFDVRFVYPSHVKKVLTGKGKATKVEMKKTTKTILQSLGIKKPDFDSHHAYDAVGNVLSYMKDNKLIDFNTDGI